MTDQKAALPAHVLLHVSQQLAVPLRGLVSTIELLDEGGTVPFIARYRKEATGNLDEVQIRSIEEKLGYFRELEDRRATILASIEEQGKLTPELKSRIEATLEKSELEDLYLPYKPKRRTKATIAREKGLEPLAEYLWNQQAREQKLEEIAATFVDAEKGVANVVEALEGARHIIAEIISENADFRKALRDMMLGEGVVVSRKSDSAEDPEEKFKMYYDYREPAKAIPSHRMLAIRRGESENILYFTIELEAVRATAHLSSAIHKAQGDWTPQLQLAIEDSWKRLLNTSIQTDIRIELKRRSDEEAIKVFRDNLQNLLLAPPAGRLTVLALDPGLRTGCKVAVIDDTGKYLENAVIYPHEPKNDTAGSTRTIEALIRKHGVKAIAIGNGTASRETEAFVRQFFSTAKIEGMFCVVVSESGASVYSASDIARQEFPELDLTVRGAISIGRRLQDPLAELVKVDAKSIGVGQYQHDVDQRQLKQSLDAVVESCVNRVGVDLNTASWALLRYVAGVNERTAQKIVEYRNENGRFRSRVQLTAVPGVGPKTFEQAAGFLRIRDGENPLDATAVHPESYATVETMAAKLGVPVQELIGTKDLLDKVEKQGTEFASVGVYTFKDIVEELRKPGRDPREQFVAPSFRDDVKELSDVQVGMKLEGVVTNVTKFGAFVDIGVHQDGLVHISELSNRYVQDPAEVVKVGQIVKVQVLAVDPKAKRIGLSMKALMGPAPQQGRPAGGPRQERGPRPQATMDDKLAALASKWKSR
ncbi:MAG: Tex family protein [Bryobacteraceae bacterium]